MSGAQTLQCNAEATPFACVKGMAKDGCSKVEVSSKTSQPSQPRVPPRWCPVMGLMGEASGAAVEMGLASLAS